MQRLANMSVPEVVPEVIPRDHVKRFKVKHVTRGRVALED